MTNFEDNAGGHYDSHPSGVECIEIVQHFNFNVGTAIKYLWRAGLKKYILPETKPNEWMLIDLRNAEYYVKKEIERVEKLK